MKYLFVLLQRRYQISINFNSKHHMYHIMKSIMQHVVEQQVKQLIYFKCFVQFKKYFSTDGGNGRYELFL